MSYSEFIYAGAPFRVDVGVQLCGGIVDRYDWGKVGAPLPGSPAVLSSTSLVWDQSRRGEEFLRLAKSGDVLLTVGRSFPTQFMMTWLTGSQSEECLVQHQQALRGIPRASVRMRSLFANLPSPLMLCTPLQGCQVPGGSLTTQEAPNVALCIT